MCVDDFSVIFFLEIGLNAKKFVLSLASMQVQNPVFFYMMFKLPCGCEIRNKHFVAISSRLTQFFR